MNTVKALTRDNISMARIPKVPFPSRPPLHALPHGAKAKREIYRVSFIGSWRSYLFWLSLIMAFLVLLVILDFVNQ